MSRPELLTPSLLRMDGRRPYEFRSLEIHFAPQSQGAAGPSSTNHNGTSTTASSPSYLAPSAGPSSAEQADGSVRLVQGLNDVTCSVFGPKDAQLSSGGRGSGAGGAGGGVHPGVGPEGAALEVEVLAENWSSVGAERRAGGRSDRRNVELSQLVQRTLTPIVSLHLYPRTSVVHISLHIASSDGSILATLINCASLALQSAGLATLDYCLATCIAFHPRSPPTTTTVAAAPVGTFLIDATLAETQDLPSLTLAVTPRDGRVVLSLLDAGRGKVESEKVSQGISVGVEVLRGAFRKEIEGATREWGKRLLAGGV